LKLFKDEELAEKAQAGNRDAESELVKRYWEKTAIVSNTFKIPGVDFETKQSICLESLVKSIRSYQNGLGAKFKTFMSGNMGRALIDLYRETTKKSSIPQSVMLNLDQAVCVDGEELSLIEVISSGEDIASELAEREAQRQDITETLGKTWPPFRDLLAGLDPSDIAANHGLSIEAVQAVIRAILHLGKFCLSDELYANLVGLYKGSSEQQGLFEEFPSRGTEQAEQIALDVYEQFKELKYRILADLIDGIAYAEIATRNGVTEEAVGRLVSAIRSIAESSAGSHEWAA
jgi:DNA-directed RNA polymerase specialized sigma24 family protein